jgi:small basic protein
MAIEDIKLKLSKTTTVLIQIGAVLAAISAMAGGYIFYLNYVWKPKLVVDSVDFEQGVAELSLGNKVKVDLFGDAIFALGGDWGVRFGTNTINGNLVYDRIELLRNGMVYEYLSK